MIVGKDLMLVPEVSNENLLEIQSTEKKGLRKDINFWAT